MLAHAPNIVPHLPTPLRRDPGPHGQTQPCRPSPGDCNRRISSQTLRGAHASGGDAHCLLSAHPGPTLLTSALLLCYWPPCPPAPQEISLCPSLLQLHCGQALALTGAQAPSSTAAVPRTSAHSWCSTSPLGIQHKDTGTRPRAEQLSPGHPVCPQCGVQWGSSNRAPDPHPCSAI